MFEIQLEMNSSHKTIILPFCGFILSITAVCLAVLSDTIIKKAVFFNSFQNAFIRFYIQLVVLMTIALSKDLNLLGPEPNRKLLVLRGLIGAIGLSCKFTAIELLSPSNLKSFFSSRIVFGAILGRMFMKEKIGTVQLFSIFLLLSGVLAIILPGNDVTNTISFV